MLRGILDNNTKTRDEINLNGLGMKKGKSGNISMTMKTGMQVSQYYNVFNYVPPIPQKELNPQDITIVAGAGIKPAPKLVPPGRIKEKVEKETSQMRLSWIICKHR